MTRVGAYMFLLAFTFSTDVFAGCEIFAPREKIVQSAPAPSSPFDVGDVKKIENVDDLFRAFAYGMVIDLTKKENRDLMRFYLKGRFGDPDTRLGSGTLETIGETLKEHPELEKDAFPEFEIAYRKN